MLPLLIVLLWLLVLLVLPTAVFFLWALARQRLRVIAVPLFLAAVAFNPVLQLLWFNRLDDR